MNNLSLQTPSRRVLWFRRFRRELPLHLYLLPAVILVVLFCYIPMVGIVIAFQNFRVFKGWFSAPWVGLENFLYVINLPNFGSVMFNTVYISVLKILFSLVVPILVALMFNEMQHTGPKRILQTVMYLPYFMSWIILGGIITVSYTHLGANHQRHQYGLRIVRRRNCMVHVPGKPCETSDERKRTADDLLLSSYDRYGRSAPGNAPGCRDRSRCHSRNSVKSFPRGRRRDAHRRRLEHTVGKSFSRRRIQFFQSPAHLERVLLWNKAHQLGRYGAVSYTHLDVYKRQKQSGNTNISSLYSMGTGIFHCFFHPARMKK